MLNENPIVENLKTKTVLTADDAAAISAAWKVEADRQGWRMSVAVVDDGGRRLSLIRYDGAGYAAVDAALRKAETSAMTRAPSDTAEKLALERLTMLALQDRLPLQGSLPVSQNCKCLGSVGISGGTSPQDEQVARPASPPSGCDD